MAEMTRGKCKYCGKEYSYAYMGRHLGACKARQEQTKDKPGKKLRGYFDLAIRSKYDKEYWLFVEIKETETLKVLDNFLRDIWVECCQHLSAFYINDVIYDAVPNLNPYWGRRNMSMNHRLKETITKGLVFRYEYDFGSTTELEIKAVNYRKGPDRKDTITLLSRNNPIEYMCEECGAKPAVYVCQICFEQGEGGFLCEDCIETHECGDEMLLPVCNSPRMGVCGYEGSERYPDQFVPDRTPDSSAETVQKPT